MATQTTSAKDYQDLLRGINQTILIVPLDAPKYEDALIHDSAQLADNSTRNGNAYIDRPNLFGWLNWALMQGNGRFSDGLAQIQPPKSLVTANNSINRLVAHQRQEVEVKPHLEAVQWIKDGTGFNQERIGHLIGVTRQTIDGWKKGTPISDTNRRRLFAVREVLERAASKHKTKELLVAWLDTPRGADGQTPAQLLEANKINKARLLAMSSPSSRLAQAPSWIRQPIPETFRAGTERRQEAVPPDPDKGLESFIDNKD